MIKGKLELMSINGCAWESYEKNLEKDSLKIKDLIGIFFILYMGYEKIYKGKR